MSTEKSNFVEDQKCIVIGCGSTEDSSFLFPFPVQNDELLHDWISRMSFLNFDEIDLQTIRICESHFQPTEIRIRSDKTLLPDATPSIFRLPEDGEQLEPNQLACRFCLKPFENKKDAISLDSTIKKHFKNFTSSELKTDNDLPDLACSECYNDVIKSSLLKSKIMENQKRLLEMIDKKFDNFEDFKIKEENESEEDDDDNFDDDFYYTEGNLEVQVQEHDNDETLNEHTSPKMEVEESSRSRSRSKPRREKKKRHRSSTSNEDKEFDDDKEKRKSESLKRKYEHAKERVLCQDCGQYFARANIKKHHLRIHIRAPPQFKCDICEKMFFRKDELKNHMKVHSGPRDKLHQCHLCDKKFATKGSLKIHFNIVHLKIGNICCEFCGKSFMNNTNYQNHLRSTHTLERPFKCDEEGCVSAYFSKGDLVDHKNRCHSNETAICPICAKVFSSKVALRNHDKRIHAEHTFHCPFEGCDKKFITNNLLMKHQKVHLGQKDHECSLCGMRYYRNTDLKRHILSIHMKVKIGCELPGCKSQFARKETYRNHVLSHHKDIGEENIRLVLESIRNMQLPAPDTMFDVSNASQ